MPLSVSERASLDHQRANLATNQGLLAKAQAAKNQAEVDKLTSWIKAEQAAIDQLVAHDLPGPEPVVLTPVPPPPAPAATQAPPPDPAKAAAFDRAMARVQEAAALLSQATAIQSQAMTKFSEFAGSLREAGVTPGAIERFAAALDKIPG